MENPTTTTVVFRQPPPIHARSETMKGNQPSSSSVISHDSSFPPSEGTASSPRSSRVLLQHSSSSSLASSRIGKRTSESTGSFQGQSTSFQSVGVANSQQSTSSAPGDEDNDGQCILVTPTGQSPSRRRTSSRTGVDTLQATVPHTLARSNSIAVARTLPHAFPSHNLPNLTFDHVTYHKLQTAGSPTSPPRAPPRSQRSSGRSQVSIADPAGQMARQHHHHHDTPSIYDDKETSPTSPLNGPGAPAFNPSAPLGETTGAPLLLPLYHHRSGAFDDRTASVVESSSAATGESLQQFALTYNSEGESYKVDDFLVDAKQQSSSFESSRDNSHQQHEHNNDNGTALSYCKVADDDDDEYSPAFDVPSGSSISSSPLSNKTTVIGHNNVVVGKTVPTEVVAKSARERLLQMHKARVELFKGKREASNTRQQQALERRQFIADHQNLRLTASWSVFALIGVIGSSFERLAFTLTARRRRRQRMGGVIIYPVVILGMRRALRRARALLLAKEHQFARPSVEHLRTDKILGLFPSNVLDSAASSLTLRYFFPNEAIIVIGCEDDEAYVLASGTADVMMGTAKVFTMQPGMVFGTIGMISGEPRSASIFARGDGCMAWIMKRAVFDAAGDSAAVTAALEVLSELRQKNIMNVYQSRLSPAALRAFPLFHSLSHETLSDVLQGSVPRVVHRGTVLAEPTSAMSTVGHLLVLKGRISISYAPHHLSAMQPICINEERFHACGDMRNVVDLPSNNSDLTKHPAVLLGAAGCHGAGNNFPVFNVTAPALLNVNPLFLPGGMLRPTPFLITAITDCDLICFSRKTLRTLDVLEAASIQQNALNVHADFFTTPKKREVAKLLLDNISSFFSDSSRTKSVLAALQASSSVDTVLGSMKMEKWVYPCGAYMSFERNSEFLINVIMDGELEQQGSSPGATTTPPSVNATSVRIWPPIAEAWFASRDAVVRVTKRAVCFRIHRRDILSWFCRALPDHSDLRIAVLVLAAHASIPTDGLACVLSFSTFDLDGAVHPEDVPAAAGGMEMPVRGALTRKFSFINNDEHTISGVLRPVLEIECGGALGAIIATVMVERSLHNPRRLQHW
ncbi:cAMP-dependent protein kinase, putative [Bodo saltans]|uniref:cAMP-dependent protein kinase, putative n=1 Tax=Bodo saltans TaxID=75058 RepID=A0A0S4IY05_BODSA|nr:cAMP-dependent protein kinase, putative [Bodo saltans]|eukprot:CUG48377.1 cAMP-dependent protein kinase, putative [Bodo saltans]